MTITNISNKSQQLTAKNNNHYKLK